MKNKVQNSTLLALVMAITVACNKPSYFGKSYNFKEPTDLILVQQEVQKSDKDIDETKIIKNYRNLDLDEQESDILAIKNTTPIISSKQPEERQQLKGFLLVR